MFRKNPGQPVPRGLVIPSQYISPAEAAKYAEMDRPDDWWASNLPANFYNAALLRGVVLATPGTGFQVSANTVNTHLKSIYTKLGVSSRSAATRFAVEQRLA